MPFAQSFNYTDISNTVYTYGRMQGNVDVMCRFNAVGTFHPDFKDGTYEDLANRVIIGWTKETAIDDDWAFRDRTCLRDMYNLGYRHSIELELPQ